MTVNQNIMRLPSILSTYGVSRAFIYKQVANGLFPSQVKLGARSVGWLKSEVDCVMLARFHGYCDERVKHLVAQLENERRDSFKKQLSQALKQQAA